ncbi:hypothetical protein J3F83DRAFT_95152 [Trichoderma novae-zelandiae]
MDGRHCFSQSCLDCLPRDLQLNCLVRRTRTKRPRETAGGHGQWRSDVLPLQASTRRGHRSFARSPWAVCHTVRSDVVPAEIRDRGWLAWFVGPPCCLCANWRMKLARQASPPGHPLANPLD